jgi:chromosome segregation ATPase
MIWNRNYGPYGHIAIVDSANLTGFTCLSQNDPVGQPTILKTYKYTSVYGWFHPKETMNADEIAVKKTDFENLVKKATMLDEILAKYGVADAQGLYSMVAGKDSRITDLTNQLGSAQGEVKNKTEELSRLTDQLTIKATEVTDLSNKLNSSLADVDRISREKGNLVIENEQLKVQIETLKQQATQGEVTLTFSELIKLILQQKITIKK